MYDQTECSGAVFSLVYNKLYCLCFFQIKKKNQYFFQFKEILKNQYFFSI
jgi:hypothetical protein